MPLQENCELRSAPGARNLLIARGLDDLGEAARVEAGAADEGAVDVWLAHEFAGILRFHAAAVLNPDSLGCGLIGHFAQNVANERVRFLRLLLVWRCARCRSPRLARMQSLFPASSFGVRPARLPRNWIDSIFSTLPLSRCSSVSPMQTIGRSAASCAARTLRLTISSVSPNNVRRSLWPSTT